MPSFPLPLALLGLGAVARAGLPPVADALSVERPANDLVTDAGQVPHPPAAHQHDGVLLKVVTDAGDVRGDLDTAGEPHTADLAQCRVGLARRGGVDAPTLGRALQRGRLRLRGLALPALADQLGDGRHPRSPCSAHVGEPAPLTAPQGRKPFRCTACSASFRRVRGPGCHVMALVSPLHAPGRSTRPGRARSSSRRLQVSAPLGAEREALAGPHDAATAAAWRECRPHRTAGARWRMVANPLFARQTSAGKRPPRTGSSSSVDMPSAWVRNAPYGVRHHRTASLTWYVRTGRQGGRQMAKEYVLAIDQGTTSTRARLFNHNGTVAGASQEEHEQIDH